MRILERFQRWKRNCLLLILGLLLFCMVLCAAAAYLVGQANAQEASPLSLDVLLLIDHSNSMWGKGGAGSDPDLLRVQAANLFIAYLGVDTARTGSRLGVIHFGGDSELIVPLTPLNEAENRKVIRDAIANPARMDWTDPLGALQLAYETLFPQDQRDLARRPVVILLSDGKPELGPARSSEERAAYVADLRALVERFRQLDCPIFTVALSNEATDADPDIQTLYRNLWQEIAARTPPAEYHEARAAADLPHVYHAIVARLTDAVAGDPVVETEVDGQAAHTLVVEEGLAKLTLVILRSDPALEVRLVRPGGAPVRSSDPDVGRTGEPGATREEVWTIADPRPGRWTLELRGDGSVVVWQDRIPQVNSHTATCSIEMKRPPEHIPAGHPISVTGIYVRRGAKGATLVEPSLQIILELRRAGLIEASFLAHDDGRGCDTEANDGYYCATLPDPPTGTCSLLVRAILDGGELARRESAFEVIPLPELAVDSPAAGTSLEPSAAISVAVRVVGFWEDADYSLAAALHGTEMEPITVPLTETAGSFHGHVTAPDRPGPLTFTFRLRGQTAQGLPFDDEARLSLSVKAPALDTDAGRSGLGWTWSLASLIGLAVLGGAVGLLIRRLRARTTLEGGLRVLQAPSGQPTGAVIGIPALPSAVLGGTGKGEVSLPGEVARLLLRAGRTPEGESETWVVPQARGGNAAPKLNDRPFETARRLCDGDVLTLGAYRLRYENLHQAGVRLARRRPQRKTNLIGGVR